MRQPFRPFNNPFCVPIRSIFNFGALSPVHVFISFLFLVAGGQTFGIFPPHERPALGHYLLILIMAWGVLFKGGFPVPYIISSYHLHQDHLSNFMFPSLLYTNLNDIQANSRKVGRGVFFQSLVAIECSE